MAWPYTYDIQYYYGDTYQFVAYPRENNVPYDLNGKTVACEIATERGNPEAVVASMNTEISTDFSRIFCSITPAIGLQLVNNNYVYDLEIRNGEEVYTLLTGDISIQRDVTPNTSQ
jgi:hypothetical protein